MELLIIDKNVWVFFSGRARKILKSHVTMMLFAKYYFLRIVKVKILEKRTKAMTEMISKMSASSNVINS